MPSQSRYQGKGFNPVSPLPFARAKEQRVEGKAARRDMVKQREKQEKDRDKELGEQQKRLEQIALGYGMSKGEAASASRGELAGFAERKAVEISENKRKVDEGLRDTAILKQQIEDQKLKNLEAKLKKEIDASDKAKQLPTAGAGFGGPAMQGIIGGQTAEADTFLHDLVRQGITLTPSLIQQVALSEMEHEKKMELRKGVGGSSWGMQPADPTARAAGTPWKPGQPGVFTSTSAQGYPQSQFVYGANQAGAGGYTAQPKIGPDHFTIGTRLYHKDPRTGEVTPLGSTQTIPALLLDRAEIEEINGKVNELTEKIEANQKKANRSPDDKAQLTALQNERKFHQARLTGGRQRTGSATPQQAPGQQQAPTPRPPNNLPGQANVTPAAPFYMQQSSGGGWTPAIDRGVLLDPQDPSKGTVYKNATAATKRLWWKEMWRLGMFNVTANPLKNKDYAIQWARANLNMGVAGASPSAP